MSSFGVNKFNEQGHNPFVKREEYITGIINPEQGICDGHDIGKSPDIAHEPVIKAERFRKVFLGGLNYRTTRQSLLEHFSKFGKIIDCVVMYDAKSRSRGFGFVTYSKSTMVDNVMNNRPHLIDGREIDVKRAMPKDTISPEITMAVRKVFVGAIRQELSENDLKDYFGQYGSITDCVVMRDKNGKLRGFGFVEFNDVDAVDKIVLQDIHIIKGQSLDIKKAIPKHLLEQGHVSNLSLTKRNRHYSTNLHQRTDEFSKYSQSARKCSNVEGFELSTNYYSRYPRDNYDDNRCSSFDRNRKENEDRMYQQSNHHTYTIKRVGNNYSFNKSKHNRSFEKDVYENYSSRNNNSANYGMKRCRRNLSKYYYDRCRNDFQGSSPLSSPGSYRTMYNQNFDSNKSNYFKIEKVGKDGGKSGHPYQDHNDTYVNYSNKYDITDSQSGNVDQSNLQIGINNKSDYCQSFKDYSGNYSNTLPSSNDHDMLDSKYASIKPRNNCQLYINKNNINSENRDYYSGNSEQYEHNVTVDIDRKPSFGMCSSSMNNGDKESTDKINDIKDSICINKTDIYPNNYNVNNAFMESSIQIKRENLETIPTQSLVYTEPDNDNSRSSNYLSNVQSPLCIGNENIAIKGLGSYWSS